MRLLGLSTRTPLFGRYGHPVPSPPNTPFGDIVELSLHQADTNGFVNLSGIAEPGGHYTVTRNDNTGQIRLNPVKVTTTSAFTADVLTGDATRDQDDPAPFDE